ncbi:hypothetical protein [Aureliella helgolandensis]|uniref:Uncharacterized protein n=1 Tax=Aureliella helgolandensis TaxID=2527968 RepID=A0A518G5F9_9BACT|nr:hypothetical protein [Aureliella helgolandensis]QDV23830.1 hypothetical protein Q31a_21350 [Aureliella helgolandensis]
MNARSSTASSALKRERAGTLAAGRLAAGRLAAGTLAAGTLAAVRLAVDWGCAICTPHKLAS